MSKEKELVERVEGTERWLKEVGEWLLDNPLGVDMLGARENFNAAGELIQELQRDRLLLATLLYRARNRLDSAFETQLCKDIDAVLGLIPSSTRVDRVDCLPFCLSCAKPIEECSCGFPRPKC